MTSEQCVEANRLGAVGGRPRQPILLDTAFEDPERVCAMVPRHAPYWPVMRYAATESELKAMSGDAVRYGVGPWFRGDWAGEGPPVEGVEYVLEHTGFAAAARSLFDAEVVVPNNVYVNLMAPMDTSATAHVDIPIFRGIEKPEYPVWLLHVMHRSGLFARWKVGLATAVAWFYEGEGGAFEYWPDGPNFPPQAIEAPLSNRAVIGDNDVMFHRIGMIGSADAPRLESATVNSELWPASPEAGHWRIVDAGQELARYSADEIRISISWKGEVFADAEAARIRREHSDDLGLDQVVDILTHALSDAGLPADRPTDPLHHPDFIDPLNELFPLPALTG
jgi:hypothetical protein